MKSLRDIAIDYAHFGFPVAPFHSVKNGACTCGAQNCPSPGKHPRTSRGIKDATTDRAKIDEWWRRWPNANIALRSGNHPTGGGFFALDVDARSGGLETLKELETKYGSLPATVVSHTGGGGLHFLFLYADTGDPIRNRTGFMPGVDVKGDNGCIIAPPSVHLSGARYQWRSGHSPSEMQLAAAPERLLSQVISVRSTDRIERPPVASPLNDQRLHDALLALLPLKAVDGNDGSLRLFTYACRCVEYGLEEEDAVRVIRSLAELKPFPRTWSEVEIIKRIRDAEGTVQRGSGALVVQGGDALPPVTLPGGQIRIVDAAEQLGRLLGESRKYFLRGGVPVTLEDGHLAVLANAAFPSVFEELARLQHRRLDGSIAPATCDEATARKIVMARNFRKHLPALKLLSPAPVLVFDGTATRVITGFDAPTGILAQGAEPPTMEFETAKSAILGLLSDFNFGTPSDLARAVGALLTPALIQGGVLGARAPLIAIEADQSQTGKGYLARVVAAIYNSSSAMRVITQRTGGVGGMAESLGDALIRGASIVVLDNWRGQLDCPALESLLTESRFHCRVPYHEAADVDPSHTTFILTSNGVEFTTDLANRTSFVSLQKQRGTYTFRAYEEGQLLDHVRANQSRYLGAVFAVIRHWLAAGRPMLSAQGHDFRRWAGAMAWLADAMCLASPIAGHAAAARRTTNPKLVWLRDVALAVVAQNRLENQLRTHEIYAVICAANVQTEELQSVDDGHETGRQDAFRRLGRLLSRCFDGQDRLDLGDGLSVCRTEVTGGPADGYQAIKLYRFSRRRILRPRRPTPGLTECAAAERRFPATLNGNAP